MRAATTDVVFEHNNCNRADHMAGTAAYEGDTSLHANISGTSTTNICLTPDDVNVTDFGNLGGTNSVAQTCLWDPAFDPNATFPQSDVRLNKAEFSWYVTPGPNCNNSKYQVENVMTHERLHTWQLADLGDPHEFQSAYAVPLKCDESMETLGDGDMNGLEVNYYSP